MNSLESRIVETNDSCTAAKSRFQERERRPLPIGDWSEAVFFHYAIDPRTLQPHIPLELDLWEGSAFVSLVAFTMRRLRPGWGGRLTSWMMGPFATQRFLNLRAYVRIGDETGIYFMTEWNSHRPCVWLAPLVYGLPYHHGSICYEHSEGMTRGCGKVLSEGASFHFDYSRESGPVNNCARGSLDEFLIERYLALASAGGCLRCFRVWHEPWLQASLRRFRVNDALLKGTQAWWGKAELVSANVSPGVPGVWMGRPQAASREFKRDRLSRSGPTRLRFGARGDLARRTTTEFIPVDQSAPDGHR